MQPVFVRADIPRTKIPDETAAIQDINRRFPQRALRDPINEGIVQPFSPGGQFNIPPLYLVANQRYPVKICGSFQGFDDFLAWEKDENRERSLDEMQQYQPTVRGSYAKDEGFGLIKVVIKGETKLQRIMVIEPFTTGARRVIGVDRGVIVTVNKEEIYSITPKLANFSSALIRGRMNVKDLPGFNDRWAAHFRDMARSDNWTFVIQALESGSFYNLTTVQIFVEAEGLPSLEIGHYLAIATAGPAQAPRPITQPAILVSSEHKTIVYRGDQRVTIDNVRDALKEISDANKALADDHKSETVEIAEIIEDCRQRSLQSGVVNGALSGEDDDEISSDQEEGTDFGDVGFWRQEMPPLIVEAEDIEEAAAAPAQIDEADGDLLEAEDIDEPDQEFSEETFVALSTIIATWAKGSSN